MGEPYASRVELFSFHTVSKGALGECGLRGGYYEAHNIHPDAVAELYKCASINLCPNVVGQIAMSLMVNEPQPGQESYDNFLKEKTEILASYRCALMHAQMHAFGVACNCIQLPLTMGHHRNVLVSWLVWSTENWYHHGHAYGTEAML